MSVGAINIAGGGFRFLLVAFQYLIGWENSIWLSALTRFVLWLIVVGHAAA
jgi:hypothetical protein